MLFYNGDVGRLDEEMVELIEVQMDGLIDKSEEGKGMVYDDNVVVGMGAY